jgi:hypothetical protein
MTEREKDASYLKLDVLNVTDLTGLIGELDIYMANKQEKKRELYESLYLKISQLWFKTRNHARNATELYLHAEYEIDSLYIKDALQILKWKFNDVCKLEGEKDEYRKSSLASNN